MADLAGMSAREMEYVLRLVESIERGISDIAGKASAAGAVVVGAIEDAGGAARRTIEEIHASSDSWSDKIDAIAGIMSERASSTTDDVINMFARLEAEGTVRFSLLGRSADVMFEIMARKAAEVGAEIKRHLTESRIGDLGTGLTSAYGGVKSAASAAMGDGPFGTSGLLGSFLYGVKKKEEWSTSAREAEATLRLLGDTAQGGIRGLDAGLVATMYKLWGSTGAEIQAAADAMVEFNVGRAEAETSFGSAAGMKNTIGSFTLAADFATNATAGTSMKFFGASLAASNISAISAAQGVKNLLGLTRELGVNYQTVSAAITQANSAMRMQNQTSEDTIRLYAQLYKGMKGLGMNDQQAADRAITGVGALTTGVAGLSIGWQGEISRRQAERGVAGYEDVKDPFARLMAYRLGSVGGGHLLPETIKDLQAMAAQAIPRQENESDKSYFARRAGYLTQGAGMTVEAAQATLLSDPEKLADAFKDSKDVEMEIRDALKTRGSQANSFEQDMRTIQMAISTIATELLKSVVNGFKLLWNQLEIMWLNIKSLPGMGGLTDKEQKVLEARQAYGMALSGDVDNSMATIGGAFKDVKGATGKALQKAFGGFGGSKPTVSKRALLDAAINAVEHTAREEAEKEAEEKRVKFKGSLAGRSATVLGARIKEESRLAALALYHHDEEEEEEQRRKSKVADIARRVSRQTVKAGAKTFEANVSTTIKLIETSSRSEATAAPKGQ